MFCLSKRSVMLINLSQLILWNVKWLTLCRPKKITTIMSLIVLFDLPLLPIFICTLSYSIPGKVTWDCEKWLEAYSRIISFFSSLSRQTSQCLLVLPQPCALLPYHTFFRVHAFDVVLVEDLCVKEKPLKTGNLHRTMNISIRNLWVFLLYRIIDISTCNIKFVFNLLFTDIFTKKTVKFHKIKKEMHSKPIKIPSIS